MGNKIYLVIAIDFTLVLLTIKFNKMFIHQTDTEKILVIGDTTCRISNKVYHELELHFAKEFNSKYMFMTFRETAIFLAISKSTLSYLIRCGGLPCYRLTSKNYLFKKTEVLDWIKKQQPKF